MEENRCISSSDTSSNRGGRPDPSSISDQVWEIAEEATWQEVLSCVQPTLDTEEKRKDVIDYVQRIIRSSIGVEVFPHGSVPLKTYLPDGDIDLTALSNPKSDDTLSRDVYAVIHAEQLNENAEYEVRDAQYIDAEVKLVKCLIQNLIIDISFNQLGGLSTLCFLEQVDRLIGKDHLFKHSIILIKAWCYYESRILGAHHGLISTYALESLILYIFHFFNSSLNGPLAVLYRFLVYFSKFDWENYGISLNGPICISSLPDIVVGNPENEDLMLSEEFLRNCVDMFSVSSRSHETNFRVFPKKHINIIDPLKENNNLGRSVNKGNYFRIRSAFKFGARKLGNILSLPRDRIADEIKNFFENTLERHGRKYVSRISDGELGRVPSSLHFVEDMHLNQSNGNNDDHIFGLEDKIRSGSRTDRDSVSSQVVLHTCYSPEGTLSSVGRSSAHFSDEVIYSPDDTISDSLSVDFREKSLDSIVGDIETSNLSDLSGDYDSHIRSLLYGQCFHGYALSSSVLSSPRSLSPSQFQNMSWDTVRQYLPLIWKMNSDSAAVGQSPYPVDNTNLSIAGFGLAERRKARGTGTYIPNPDRNSLRERPSQGRRNQGQETHWQLQKYTVNNIVDSTSPRTLDTTLPRSNSIREGDHKIMKEQSLVFDCEKHDSHRHVHAKSVNSHGNDISTSNRKLELDSTLLRTSSFQGSHKLMKEQPSVFNGEKQDTQRQLVRAKSVNSNGNGIPVSNRKLEFGSFGSFTEGNYCQLGLGNSTAGESTSSPTARAMENSKEAKSRKLERVQEKSINLENDDDFPPLTS